MAEQQLPVWNSGGIEPPANLQQDGWQPGVKPPAQYFDWLFNRAYKCLEELQTITETLEINKADAQGLKTLSTTVSSIMDGTAIKQSTINAGEYLVESTIKSPVNVLRIDGKTIVNHVPPFNSGVWKLGANAVATAPNKLTINADGTLTTTTLDIPVKPNTTYTITAKNIDVSHELREFNGTTEVVLYAGIVRTITTGANTNMLRITLFKPVASGSFSIEDISVNEGTQALPYVANVKGLTNPTIVNETNGTSLVVPTTLYAEEYVERNAKGELVKYKKRQDRVLDGSESWTFGASYTGFKVVQAAGVVQGIHVNDTHPRGVKFNGSILKQTVDQADVLWVDTSNSTLFIGISNADSGWGPDYAPTVDEIKAYFLGWRMDTQGIAYPAPYNGTGTKEWVKIDVTTSTGISTEASVLVVPTTMNDKPWQPYRLVYEFATPVQEVVQPYGDLTLEKGINTVKVYAGRIVNERSRITFDGGSWNINNPAAAPGAPVLTRKIVDITAVYENSKVVTAHWKKVPRTDLNGMFVQTYNRVLADPTASYTVDYEPLYAWEVTAPIDSVQLQYFDTLQAVTNELVYDAMQQQGTVKRMLENAVNDESGLVWIKPTFVNGVTGASTCRYAKDTNGTVYLFIYLNISKAMADTETLFMLPKGYRPKDAIYIPSIEYVGIDVATRKSGIMAIHPSGPIRAGVTTGNASGSIIAAVTFKAEQ